MTGGRPESENSLSSNLLTIYSKEFYCNPKKLQIGFHYLLGLLTSKKERKTVNIIDLYINRISPSITRIKCLIHWTVVL